MVQPIRYKLESTNPANYKINKLKHDTLHEFAIFFLFFVFFFRLDIKSKNGHWLRLSGHRSVHTPPSWPPIVVVVVMLISSINRLSLIKYRKKKQ